MSGKWKIAILILVGLILCVFSVSDAYDFVEVNNEYAAPFEENYKIIASDIAPDSGLLEVSCYFWEDRVSMTATIDNTSVDNVVDALIAGLQTYQGFLQ